MSVRLTALAVAAAVCLADGAFLRDGRRARSLAEADESVAAKEEPHTNEKAEPTALVETNAKWRFNTNYVPQHYGNWKFEQGKWNFGADDRVQCESCGYCLYFAVDQLGDNFDAQKVSKVLTEMTNDVQWVFKSACEHIVKHSKAEIVASMMKLVEPQVGVIYARRTRTKAFFVGLCFETTRICFAILCQSLPGNLSSNWLLCVLPLRSHGAKWVAKPVDQPSEPTSEGGSGHWCVCSAKFTRHENELVMFHLVPQDFLLLSVPSYVHVLFCRN